jgi:hypothetical protein
MEYNAFEKGKKYKSYTREDKRGEGQKTKVQGLRKGQGGNEEVIRE